MYVYKLSTLFLWMLVVGLAIPYLVIEKQSPFAFESFSISEQELVGWLDNLERPVEVLAASGKKEFGAVKHGLVDEHSYYSLSSSYPPSELNLHLKSEIEDKAIGDKWKIAGGGRLGSSFSLFLNKGKTECRLYVWIFSEGSRNDMLDNDGERINLVVHKFLTQNRGHPSKQF